MFGVTHSIFALILLLGPPEGDAPPADEPILADSDTSGEASYERTIEQLGHGITLGDEQPKEAITILEDALAELPRFTPRLANDPEALALRAEAYVSLARAYLTVRDETKAREALDEGLRSAPFGHDLPVNIYGPRVEKLWKKMKAGESPRQDVEVNCWVKCRVYLNERSVGASEPILDDEFAARARLVDLKAGRYRLWIEAADGSIDPLITEFEPREPGEPPLDFIFGTKPEPEQPTRAKPKPAPRRESPERVPPRTRWQWQRDIKAHPQLGPMWKKGSRLVGWGSGVVGNGVAFMLVGAGIFITEAISGDGQLVNAGSAFAGTGLALLIPGAVMMGLGEDKRNEVISVWPRPMARFHPTMVPHGAGFGFTLPF